MVKFNRKEKIFFACFGVLILCGLGSAVLGNSSDNVPKTKLPSPTVSTSTIMPSPTFSKTTPTPTPSRYVETSEPEETYDFTEDVEEEFYKNCKEAKAAGAAPMYEGESGYRAKLDRNSDGVACE